MTSRFRRAPAWGAGLPAVAAAVGLVSAGAATVASASHAASSQAITQIRSSMQIIPNRT